MLDRMLGGAGQPLDKTRDFSEIEMSILDKIMVMCMNLLRDPWKNVLDVEPILERIESNPQFAQVIAPNEMIAIVTLNVKIGDVEGYMNICLPFITMEPVMDKLNTKYWFSSMQEAGDDDYQENIESLIRRVEIPIKAVLGKSQISVMDFSTLQIGDIIRLDSRVEDELDVYVGNYRKFTALPGVNKENYAVRVTSVLREED
jgi:flagellar motor switch protein FliM